MKRERERRGGRGEERKREEKWGKEKEEVENMRV